MLPSVGASRNWIHPASVTGKFTKRHRLIGRVLIGFLLLAPWIRWGDHPLFLLDLATRQVFVGPMVFTPRDTILLLTALMGSGFMLFLVTSLWGRLWCGYACPQTVLLEEIIRRIEKWVDGERGARMRLAKAPWNAEKIRKRALKWFLFLLVSFGLAMSFTSFFSDPLVLWTGNALSGTYVFVAALTGVFFLDFAWFREQFCHYLCPYARFQGVMTDDHTVQIGYDFARGEPRKPKGVKMADLPADTGACVDCNRCVAVCPSGIDIRDGFQLECIACARCVDACTDVMDKLGQPTLVKYASLAQFEGREEKKKGVRVRPAIYGAATAIVSAVFVFTFFGRVSFDVTIAQDRNTAEIATDDGGVRNLYQITLHNNSQRAQEFEITADLPGAELTIPGSPIVVEPAGRRAVPAFVTFGPADTPDRPITTFDFVVESGGTEVRHAATFRSTNGPGS